MRKLIILIAICFLCIQSATANIEDYESSLVLLLHGNQSYPAHPTYIYDSSPSNKTVTVGGSTTTNISVKYLGNASIFFDGTGDYLYEADSSDWNMGTGNWTVMYWIYPNQHNDTYAAYYYKDINNKWGIYDESTGKVGFYAVDGGVTKANLKSANTTTAYTWSQVVVERAGTGSTSIRMWINGVETTTSTINLGANATPYTAGGVMYHGVATTPSGLYRGNFDELAIWKGVAIPISELYPQTTEIGGHVPPIPTFADYGNVTSYYYNITAGMGTQTDYQVKFILSNSSGVSGYYAPDNIIYTNGTTRADWYDINATDESNTPLKFWVENNTATAYNITAWVKVPSIATGNTSTGKWYYGNASQSASTMDGLNTFAFFDDFLSLNTSKWTVSNTSPTVSGGILSYTGAVVNSYILGINGTGTNYTMHMRVNADKDTGINMFGMRDPPATNLETAYVDARYDGSGQWRSQTKLTTGETTLIGNLDGTYRIVKIKRNTTAGVNFLVDGIALSTHTSKVPTSTLYPLAYVSNTTGVYLYLDWMHVSKSVPTEPTTSLYSTTSGAGAPDIVASFTDVPDPSTTGETVTFTDTSTGSPTTWNWTFGDGNTSTTQNPTYAFPDAGSFWVDLNVTNSTGSFSNYTALHTVVNASSFTPQDVWMEGQYNRTFHITSSSDGTPLAANYITSDGQTGTASTLGYAFITEGFGVYTITVSMTGYSTRTVSFIVDEDGTTEIQLTPYTDVTATRWTSTHDVVFYVRAITGEPVEDVNVTAVYIEESGGEGWLQSWAGVPSDVNVQNTTMHGTTGSDGAIDFLMVQSAKYHVTAYKSGVIDSYMDIYPKDDYYVFRQGFNSSVFYEHGADETKNIRFNVSRTELNETYGRIRIEYTDLMDQTTQVVILVNNSTSVGNLTTETTVVSYTSTAAGNFTYNFDMEGTRGNSYLVRCNSTGTVFPEVKRDYGVTFLPGPITLGIPEEFLVYAGMFVLIFIALCFTRTLPGPAVIVIMFFAWIFYMMRWWRDLGPDLIVGAALVFFTVAAVIFNVMIRSKKRIFE